MSDRITLAHGAGGKEMEALIRKLFARVKLRSINNAVGLDYFDDASQIITSTSNVIVSIDSYTVDPIFFPGGNIGKLAATGSINDVAVMGASPVAALDSIVVEEGFRLRDLEEIIDSLVKVFESEGVALLGGDFKVMPKGKIDKIVITTVVIGYLPDSHKIILDSKARPGDKVIVSGTIGEHGAVITALRMGIDAELGELKSDCMPVTRVMKIAMENGEIHAAKDPTRGGLAMALNEIAEKSGVSVIVDEEEIPIRDEVIALSEMLGVDPLSLACEGRVVMTVDPNDAENVVKALHRNGFSDARIIGEVKKEDEGIVLLRTKAGGLRILEKPTGELTPRIC